MDICRQVCIVPQLILMNFVHIRGCLQCFIQGFCKCSDGTEIPYFLPTGLLFKLGYHRNTAVGNKSKRIFLQFTVLKKIMIIYFIFDKDNITFWLIFYRQTDMLPLFLSFDRSIFSLMALHLPTMALNMSLLDFWLQTGACVSQWEVIISFPFTHAAP